MQIQSYSFLWECFACALRGTFVPVLRQKLFSATSADVLRVLCVLRFSRPPRLKLPALHCVRRPSRIRMHTQPN